MRLMPLVLVAVLASCASTPEDPVVRLTGDRIELNGKPIDSVAALGERLDSDRTQGTLAVEAHVCVESARLAEVATMLRDEGYRAVSLSHFGAFDDPDCAASPFVPEPGGQHR